VTNEMFVQLATKTEIPQWKMPWFISYEAMIARTHKSKNGPFP